MQAKASMMVSTTQRPTWLSVLAIFSWLLAAITAIPQFFYVLFASHALIADPHSNIIGQLWYWYGQHFDASAIVRDPGSLAGAVEDAFLLGPLYLVTGLGLWFRRTWVIPVALITGSMIFYAILYYFLVFTFQHAGPFSTLLSFWITSLPYLAYPVWLVATVITRRSLFTNKGWLGRP